MRNKILYVDDEESNLILLKMALKDRYDLVTQSNPLEALKVLVNKNDFKAVISDWKMPQMSGIAFITEARKFTKEIPFFMLSGYNPDDQIAQMLDEGIICGFFQKPTSFTTIVSALNENGVE